jgi:hypothetical protein
MSHYYKSNGDPCHTVPKKGGGGERSTTIADARKLKLKPSVTTVLSILSKPSLDRWKFRQITDACYRLPAESKEFPDAYCSRMVDEAFQQVDDAADLGTLIHDALDSYFSMGDMDLSQVVDIAGNSVPLSKFCKGVGEWANGEGVDVVESELTLVNHKYGYAGKTDVVMNKGPRKGILDFKTRKFDDPKKCKPYDEHPMQIAAYHMAKYGDICNDSIGCNLYISTTKKDLIHAVWYEPDELRKNWEIFKSCLNAWCLIKNYQSGDGHE